MASKSVVMRVCDLHKESVPAVKTIRFSWDGARHQLDLCTDHLGEVESTMNSWVRSAPANGSRRRAGRAQGAARKGRPAAKRSPAKRPSAAAAARASRELRAWAKANGFDVSDRGRIPSNVRTAFETATK